MSDENNSTTKLVITGIAAGGIGLFGGTNLDLLADRTQTIIDNQVINKVNDQFDRLNGKLDNIEKVQQRFINTIENACR